ncbi:MT-A70 family methyltransferase, partial [Streptomyces sp. P9(2023)]|uniref:MT-A70 family methyltransferase n=1 Tax=Streptomyces sp. P9(2023) TaxID=3064394 RepID=UPI0028F4180A
TGGAWIKRTPAGKTAFGTGYVLRSASEPFLVGKIGSPAIRSKSCRNVIEASDGEMPDLIDSVRREHSRKPPEMRKLIDQLLPDVWGCELFARGAWPGRDIWGNQTDRFGGCG